MLWIKSPIVKEGVFQRIRIIPLKTADPDVNPNLRSNVFLLSEWLCQDNRNVGTLRSDIPTARPTFNGHSEVYR